MGDEHHPVGRSQAKRGRDGEELADEHPVRYKQDGDQRLRKAEVGLLPAPCCKSAPDLWPLVSPAAANSLPRGAPWSRGPGVLTGRRVAMTAGMTAGMSPSLVTVTGGPAGTPQPVAQAGTMSATGTRGQQEEKGTGDGLLEVGIGEGTSGRRGERQAVSVTMEVIVSRSSRVREAGAGPDHRMAIMPACQREQQGGRGRDSSGGREDKGGRAAQGDRTTREEGWGGAGREERGSRGGREDRNEKGAVEERGDKAARDGRGDRGGRPHHSDLRGDTYPRDTERGRPAREHPDTHRTPLTKFESDSWGARPAARPRAAPGSVWEVVTWRDGSSRPVHERDSAPNARPHGREGRPGDPQENGRRGGAGAGEERGQPGTETATRRLGGQGAREEGWPNGDLPRRYGSSRSQFQSVTPASARPRYTSWGRPQDEVDRWEGGQGSEGTGLGEVAGGGFGGERHPPPGLVGGGPPHGRGHARHGAGPDQIPYPRMGPGRSLSTGRGAEWMEQGPQGFRGRMLPEQQMFQQAPYRPPARPRSPEPSKWAHDKFEALEADEEGAAAVV
ncbi:hypothetical protein V8C86DRAFT_3210213 [Haematococcus lacustris]